MWERDGRLSEVLERSEARYPPPKGQWIEDRFWIWVHYAARKIARGELYEANGLIAGLRGTVLGPLAPQRAGQQPNRTRRLETYVPDLAAALEPTVAGYTRPACCAALRSMVDVYRQLRAADDDLVQRTEVERAVLAHLYDMERRS